MATHPRRRVSYIIPGPTEPIPRLRFPPHGTSRLGLTGPLLIPVDGGSQGNNGPEPPSRETRYPRHRLGVSSLALDTSTQLNGRAAPEGILYSGGRDGLVNSWDLGIPMKPRQPVQHDGIPLLGGRWETMTGWGDNQLDDDFDDLDDRPTSDGDVLGEVTPGFDRRKRKTSKQSYIPQEQRWETDLELFKPGQASCPFQFRQCAQMHADWVNDILLCNNNQTVIGSHQDYVRCLTHCREQNWIASGSSSEAIITLNPADANAPKSSVYAIATDPYGQSIASGSPERVVRMWDPRSGKRTAKFVGHTDNIRAILISDDSKYLWSLSSQRCLHTFTHHTDSVWSLFSSHPSLEIFYSGDRSGLVCRVDVEDCSDVSDGECIVLCQDLGERGTDGINKIVAMDENVLWTATGSSTIKRWQIPQKRTVRANALTSDVDGSASRDKEDQTTLYGIPFESLVRLISANDPFTPFKGRDPEVATLYSAASVKSVPRTNIRSPTTGFQNSSMQRSRTEETVMVMPTPRAEYEDREIAVDAVPLCSTPGRSDTSGEVAVWDIDVSSASHHGSAGSTEEQDLSPREALEIVRERIEGEAVVSPWATADTKTGILSVHLTEKCFEAEVFADEVGFSNDRHFNDESKLNPGKWVLRNLFIGFIREEQRLRKIRDSKEGRPSQEHRRPHKRHGSSSVISSKTIIPATPSLSSRSTPASPLLPTMIPLYPLSKDNTSLPLPIITQNIVLGSNDPTPMPLRHRAGTLDNTGTPVKEDYFMVRNRTPGGGTNTPDDFSSFGSPKTEVGPQTPSTPGGGLMGRLKSFGRPKRPQILEGPLTPPSSSEAPSYHLPANLAILISEEAPSGYKMVYRGTVSSTALDIGLLEDEMPVWLVEYLLLNRIPVLPTQAKMSFVLLPWPAKGDEEQLPELLNTTQSKLTASRFLRVRKLVVHMTTPNSPTTPTSRSDSMRSSLEGHESQTKGSKLRAEDLYEVLCNEVLLPLDMTLAVARQYVWRQSTELVIHYRRKL
ncbi:hypothetical protein C8J56DRAFT_1003600 [Mycena floridula]|nr:hypothetical protein C8J56DRAFT_1003600 [Mycena floridula]